MLLVKGGRRIKSNNPTRALLVKNGYRIKDLEEGESVKRFKEATTAAATGLRNRKRGSKKRGGVTLYENTEDESEEEHKADVNNYPLSEIPPSMLLSGLRQHEEVWGNAIWTTRGRTNTGIVDQILKSAFEKRMAKWVVRYYLGHSPESHNTTWKSLTVEHDNWLTSPSNNGISWLEKTQKTPAITAPSLLGRTTQDLCTVHSLVWLHILHKHIVTKQPCKTKKRTTLHVISVAWLELFWKKLSCVRNRTAFVNIVIASFPDCFVPD